MKICFFLIFLIFLFKCTENKKSQQHELTEFELKHGIGPVKELITINDIDKEAVNQGKIIFYSKCTSCHRLDNKLAGPPLRNVIEKRSPEYILNIIVNPVDMTLYHPTAKNLALEYGSQMTYQNVSFKDAYKILDFLRFENLKDK